MHWQGGKLKIQNPSVPKPCKKITSLVSCMVHPKSHNILVVPWRMQSHDRKAMKFESQEETHMNTVVFCSLIFSFPLLSHGFFTCTFGKALAGTLQMLPLLLADVHRDNAVQQTLHNLIHNAKGIISTTIMKPTALCWEWVLSWLSAQAVCHNMYHDLQNPQIISFPWLIYLRFPLCGWLFSSLSANIEYMAL